MAVPGARNLLIDANRAARARPMTVPGQQAGDAGTDSGLEKILDRQLVSAALAHLSPAHQSVLVETFYRGGTMATVARELGITARHSQITAALRARCHAQAAPGARRGRGVLMNSCLPWETTPTDADGGETRLPQGPRSFSA